SGEWGNLLNQKTRLKMSGFFVSRWFRLNAFYVDPLTGRYLSSDGWQVEHANIGIPIFWQSFITLNF
ncbi:MAG TPA: hypothetical protein VGQ51_09470, partial [Puia sp.]|nr:hypothetical protein [Puia sp.]